MRRNKNITSSKSIRRVIIGFFVLILLFGISEFISFRNLKKSKEISSRNSTVLQPSIILLSDLRSMVTNSEDYSDSWVFFDISDHEDKRALEELHYDGFNKLISEIESISKYWEVYGDIQSFHKIVLDIDSVRREQTWLMHHLATIENYGDLTIKVEAEGIHLEQIKHLSRRINHELNAMIKSFKDRSKAEEKKAQRSIKSIETVHLILAVLAFVIALVVAWVTIRAVRLQEQKSQILKERDKINSQKVLIEEKNKEILSSLNYAKRLQSSMLPASVQFQNSFSDHFVIYKPRDIVSGDFYWLRKVDSPSGDILFVAAADATGHGVPGAFVSFVCYSSLNRSMDEFELVSPSGILDKTSELVAQTFNNNGEAELSDGMDIALMSFHLEKKSMRFSGAHNGALIIRNGEPITLAADRKSVGKDYNTDPFSEQDFQLQSGDSIYLFSDGYADQFGGEKNKKFMLKNLVRLLCEISEKPMSDQQRILESTLAKWKGSNEQLDDIVMLGMRI